VEVLKVGPGIGAPASLGRPATPKTDWNGFGDLLRDAINQADALQKEADTQSVRLAAGDVEDLHEVVLATEKARIATELAIQIRNKALEAYQEIMRMQV
jgi:flagellar hook-basal body complex protein FliE